jgi:RND family efflux transporter MFP subunit
MRPHRSRQVFRSAFSFLFAFGCGAFVFGCGANEYAPPPPPGVTAQHPVVRDVTRYAEYTGTTRAVESVEVRARVKGFLLSMEYEAGDDVEEGDLLFIIDPEPFQVALEAAQADLASNQAELDLTQTEFERIGIMYKKQATSEIKLIRSRAERDKAAAAVAASKADVHAAQLDLDYAHVKAPIKGRAGRHHVDIGNLVGAQDATLLTNMVRYAPIYVYFHLSERDLLALQKMSQRRRNAEGKDYENRPATPVEVGLADEEGYPHRGIIDFTGLQVDPNTGTYEVRGILPNVGELDEVIVPGTFVRVRVPIGQQPGAILLGESALGADQSGRYVLVVNDDNVVEHRRVEVGPMIDGLRVIEEGLGAEDWVIVEGIQRARPGSQVAAERNAAGAKSAPDAAPAAAMPPSRG